MHENTTRADGADDGPVIEHLVTWEEDDGCVVVVGLDAQCRPVYTTTL
jgi:hypothetical protein